MEGCTTLLKKFSYQLYTKAYKETFSFNSSNYVIYFGDTPTSDYILPFPSELKTPFNKQKFILQLLDLYELKRENRNRRQRQYYQDRVARKLESIKEAKRLERNRKERERYHRVKKKDSKKETVPPVPRKPKKPIKLEKREHYITTTTKSARGVFNPKDMYFRHITLAYKKPLTVNTLDQVEFDKLKEIIKQDFRKLIDRAFKYKRGERLFILKLLTPYYDDKGLLMYDDEIVDKDSGKKWKAHTNYSFGFSIGRTRKFNRQNLLQFADMTIGAWEKRLIEKYVGLTSRIDLAGLLLEEVL